MSISSKGKYLNPNYAYGVNEDYDKNDIIYYNLSLNAGFNTLSPFVPDLTTSLCVFDETNQNDIVEQGDNWSVAVMRCTLPTISVPRLIMPVVIGQPNINKCYNVFSMAYYDVTNTLQSVKSLNVNFVSEILNPTPVSTGMFSYPYAPTVRQDTESEYYFIYYVESILKMFNDTLYQVYQLLVIDMATKAPPVVLDPLLYPFLTYDDKSQLFSMNCPSISGVNSFRTDLNPSINIYIDDYTLTLLGLPSKYQGIQTRPNLNCVWNVTVNNLFDNIVEYENKDTLGAIIKYYKMESDQTSVINWGSLQSVVFQINQGINIKNQESDSVPVKFQQSTAQNLDKPIIPMLTDLEVDKSQFTVSNQFVQFQASSIEQVRLIPIGSSSNIRNIQITAYWKDNFGNRRPLYLTASVPATCKLAFFRKKE